MSDIKTIFNGTLMTGDFVIEGNDLSKETGLDTAIIQSLFTDRRAKQDDALPDGTSDKRGWWGNSFILDQEQIGSRLWLLRREKNTPEALARAKDYAKESLKWLVTDGIAATVEVVVEAVDQNTLGIAAIIHKPNGDQIEYKYNYLWDKYNGQ